MSPLGPDREWGDFHCMCYEFVSATEAAALAAGRWMGQGDAVAAERAATDAMYAAFSRVPVSGNIVVAREQDPNLSPLAVGAQVGAGGRPVDIALRALEGANIVARGQDGAISVLAAAAPGNILHAPEMYMQKIAVGAPAAGKVDIEADVEDNLEAVAEALGLKVSELTVVVLERPRHDDLVAALRRAGARIKLISDGDVVASIAAAVKGTGDHVSIGIGGTTEGVITAAAMQCLGGEIVGKFWPLSRREIEVARQHGIEDIEANLRTQDLVRGEVVLSATGVTSGDVLRGVEYRHEGARTHTIVMCTKCRQVRFIETIHSFSPEPEGMTFWKVS